MTQTQFVVDNSTVMAWCFEDETSEYAEEVLHSLRDVEAIAPAVWPLEVGNVLLVAERSKRITQATSARFVELLNDLPIVVESEDPSRALREVITLARELGLTTYDASYLDLAMRLALPLATQDKKLIAAAKACGVERLGVRRSG